MSYKKQRPLTANFPAKERRTWNICNSEIAPEEVQRPKTALSRHIVDELDKQLGTKGSIPLKKYERLNDPKMDPVVVKAVRSFAKKKKIVTHDSIIDIGERVAKEKEQKHIKMLEEAVHNAVMEERERLQAEFKEKSELEKDALKSTWIEKIDNTDQIAAEAAEAAAKKVRNEMQEKLDMMEQVHHSVLENTVREKLAKAREEWRTQEKEHVRLVRLKCDTEYHETLEEVVAERLQEKKKEWATEEEKRIVALSEELKEFYLEEIKRVKEKHDAVIEKYEASISDLETKIQELQHHVVFEQHEHKKTKAVLQGARQHVQYPRYTRACMYKWGMEEEESPDAEFIRDLQDFFLPYSTADADQEVVLDLTLQYFTLLRICYKITQQSSGVYDEFTDHVMNLLYYIEGYKSCMNDTLDYLENTLEMEETSEAVCNMKNHIINHIAELLHQHLGNCPQVVLLELCDPYLPEMFRLANNPQLLETT